jgi:hypothetical protein
MFNAYALVRGSDGVTGIAIGSRARALGPRGSDRSGPFMYNIYVVGMNARPDDQRLHTRLKGHKADP